MWPRLSLRGGFYTQYVAFLAKLSPFYDHGAAIKPARAALKASILLLQQSNFHFTLVGPRLSLRGGIKAQYLAFEAKPFSFHAYEAAIRPAGRQ